MGNYVIDIDASDGNLEQVKGIVGSRIAQEPEEVQQLIDIQYRSFSIRDYGVNPLADRDSRAFVDLINPSGKSMLPLSDVAIRRSTSDMEAFVRGCLKIIKQDAAIPS